MLTCPAVSCKYTLHPNGQVFLLFFNQYWQNNRPLSPLIYPIKFQFLSPISDSQSEWTSQNLLSRWVSVSGLYLVWLTWRRSAKILNLARQDKILRTRFNQTIFLLTKTLIPDFYFPKLFWSIKHTFQKNSSFKKKSSKPILNSQERPSMHWSILEPLPVLPANSPSACKKI